MVKSKRFPELRNVLMRPHEVAVLAERLLERGADDKEAITRKLARAEEDMDWAKAQQERGNFAKVVVNAVAEAALGELKVSVVQWYPHIERFAVHHGER